MSTKIYNCIPHNLRSVVYNYMQGGEAMNYDELFYERLISLRTQKGVSARDMSISLGQSESYINKIENKKTLPSMTVFFYICEYFGIHPKEFFDNGLKNPKKLNEIIAELNKLNEDQLGHLLAIVKDIKEE